MHKKKNSNIVLRKVNKLATNRKLGRTTDIRLAMLKTLTTDVIMYGKVQTTEARAKEIREEPNTITPDITAEKVAIRRFYGMYNTYPVVIVRNSLLVETDIFFDVSIEIAGVTFKFGHRREIADLVLYKPLS